MKIELPLPGNTSQKLLFSNVGTDNVDEFHLLMTYHRTKRGGFDYPVTVDECKRALKKTGKGYRYVTI